MNPESGTINYAYDANGNLITKTDARSITTTYAYDALNRVVTRNYSDATADVSYFYDNLTNAKGKLIKVQNSLSTTEYTSFDILGRVTGHKQITDGEEYETGYVYNLSGALIEQTYPSGRVVKNVLDKNGDLSMVQSARCGSTHGVSASCADPHGYWNYANSFTYNAAGAVTSMQLGNGRWESTQFNSRLQPTQIALGATNGATNLLKLDYSYGTIANNGNVMSQTITVPTVGGDAGFTAVQNYTYDSLNRLKSAEEEISSQTSWKQAFTFDRYGNRNFDEAETTTLPKACIDNAVPVVCSADKKIVNPAINTNNNRLSTSDDYVFDNAGNTTEDAHGRTFIYDAENKQVEVKDQYNNTIGEYRYDGDGRRVKKIVPSTGEVTVFVYSAGGQLVAEYSTIQPTTPKVSYTTADHLGSPRLLTDENGAPISRRDFHPFGEEITTPERTAALGYQPDDVRQKFTGYEWDIESSLDFAEARYFNSGHGRFTSVDPLLESAEPGLPQTWNRYVYCLNNPLNLIDPDGQKWEFANEDLQKAFEEAVKAKGDKAWKAYQTIANAKGVIKVGFGELRENQFGNTSVSVNYNTSWDVKNGKKVNFKSELTVNGTITLNSNGKALDTSNFTDLVSASAHEFTHVLSEAREAGVPGFSGLVPADGVTKKEEQAGKQSFPVESAAFEAQVQAEKAMIAKGNKPVSPDTSLGRANAAFGKLTTPTEKYDYLSKTYTNFKQPRPGPQPAKKK